MKFMTMVKTTAGSVKSAPPPALMDGIMKLGMEAGAAGVLVEQGGLMPIEHGGFVTVVGGEVRIVDGPMSEAKELVGGYAVYQVKSKAEALEWARRFADLHRQFWPGWEGEIEIRQLMEY